MQATQDKDFDKLFQQKFESFEVEPSSAVWRGIASELDKKEGKKKAAPLFQMIAIAATVLVVLSTGFWLFSPQEKIRLRGKDSVVMQGEVMDTIADEPVAEQIVKAKESKKFVASAAESAVVATSKPDQAEKTNIQEPQRTAEVVVKESEPVKQPKTAVKETTVYQQTEQPVLAFVENPSSDIDDKKDVEQQHRVKTVGDLVNFVIGKVDPRTDKIIQFKNDEDGGSEITGINLGLLKFKNRNK